MRVRGSSALAAGALLALPLAAQGDPEVATATTTMTTTMMTGQTPQNPNAVMCDGTGLMIESGLWGVSGASLHSRVELAAGGPNLM
jgi:hypothetical protein